MLTGQILTGMEYNKCSINSIAKLKDQYNGITYLGRAWKQQQAAFEGMCQYNVDCAVSKMFKGCQEQYVDCQDDLVRISGIDLKWRMNQVSHG